MKQKRKWLFLTVFGVLLCLTILGYLFRDSFMLYFMPKSVLKEALSEAVTQIETRFQENPLDILQKGIDADGNQRAELELSREDPLFGEICYDMLFLVQPHRLYGEGTAYNGQRDLDLSVYLDTDFMAVSSDDLLRGSYYGIHYDTFPQDIRRIPLLDWMLGENVLSKWENTVHGVQAALAQDVPFSVPQLPQLSAAQRKAASLAALALPLKVEKCTALIQGEKLDCHRMVCSLEGEAARKLLQEALEVPDTGSAEVRVAFYLSEKHLVMLDALITTGERGYHASIEFGSDIEKDPILVKYRFSDENQGTDLVFRMEDKLEGEWHREKWYVSGLQQSPIDLSCSWNTSGQVVLKTDPHGSVSFRLTETEDGFRMDSEDFSKLYEFCMQKTPSSKGNPLKGSITIGKGRAFDTPAYKNLDQWSMEDFLILLEGVGSLIGITLRE